MRSRAHARKGRPCREASFFGNAVSANRRLHTASLLAPRSRQLQSAARGSSRSGPVARSRSQSAPIFLRKGWAVGTTRWSSWCQFRHKRGGGGKLQLQGRREESKKNRQW